MMTYTQACKGLELQIFGDVLPTRKRLDPAIYALPLYEALDVILGTTLEAPAKVAFSQHSIAVGPHDLSVSMSELEAALAG